jgi:hypothetical protein
MFERLGRLTTARPWLVCAAWVVAGIALTLIAPAWDTRTQDDDIRFLPERCPSVRGYQLLQQAFSDDVFASRLVFAIERDDAQLTEADLALVRQVVDDLEQFRKQTPELNIGKITSCFDGVIGSRLTSQDRHCTLIQVLLRSPFLALQTFVVHPFSSPPSRCYSSVRKTRLAPATLGWGYPCHPAVPAKQTMCLTLICLASHVPFSAYVS